MKERSKKLKDESNEKFKELLKNEYSELESTIPENGQNTETDKNDDKEIDDFSI